MASELRVNTSTNRVGLGTITYTDTGPIISGITTGNNFKTGSTNVHSTGVELTNINTGGATATFGGYISLPQKIIHTGDPDTSIEFDNNIILFETAGAEKLRITSGGDVEVFNGSNSSTIKLKRHTSTASEQAHIGYFSSGLHIETREATYITLKTNTTEKLRITSGGKVNIGGDYTQTDYNLSVTDTGGNLFRIKTANEGDYDLRFMIQNSESNIWHYGTDDFAFGNRYDRKLHFITNGQKRVTIDGNLVGINNVAPSYILDAVGDSGGAFTASSNSTSGQLSIVGKNSGGSVSAISRIKSEPSGNGNTSQMVFQTRNSSAAMVEAMRITATQDLVVGGNSVGANGSFGIQPSGHVRTVLTNGSGTGDTLFGAIGGVSNGFQINVDSSNNQNYYFHNGSSRTVSIRSTGRTEFGATNGNYGSNPRTVTIGSRAANIAGSLAIARGESLGGGTGPYMEFVHGPDGGTQRIHQIYSYTGDLRIETDSNENLELLTGGAVKAKLTNTGRFQLFDGTANYIESADFRLTNSENPSDHSGHDLILTARYNTNTTLISAANTGTGGGTRITFTKACYVLVCMSQDARGNTDTGYWSVTLKRDNSIIGYHLMMKNTHWDMFTFQQATYVGANSYLTINWNGVSGWTNADANSWSHYTIMAWENR